MKMTWTHSTILIVALFWGALAAESAPAVRQVDLKTCVEMALERNPLNRIARESVEMAEAEVGAARSAYYPELAANASYARWERRAWLPSGLLQPGIPGMIGPTDDWYSGLSAGYTILDSGRRRAKVRGASAVRDAAAEDEVRVKQEIAFRVEQAYYQLAAALEMETAALRAVERAQAHLRLADTRKQVGAVPQVDVVRAQVEVANARLGVEKARKTVQVARGELNTAIGLPVDSRLEIDRRRPPLVLPDSIPLTRELERAKEERPDLKAARQRVTAAGTEVSAAKRAFGPILTGEARFGWRDDRFLPEDRDWLVGLSIQLPVFDGFRRKHELAGARAELSREEAEYERLVQDVQQQIWAAYSRVRESYAVLESTDALVRDAAESLRLADERYQAGAGTVSDLLDSETALARAEATRVASQWEYHSAVAELRYATGTGN